MAIQRFLLQPELQNNRTMLQNMTIVPTSVIMNLCWHNPSHPTDNISWSHLEIKNSFFKKMPNSDHIAQTLPCFRPTWSKAIPSFKPTRLENHTLCGRTYRLLPHPTLLGLISYSAKGLGTNLRPFTVFISHKIVVGRVCSSLY